jgi:large subunit ribosomal protein L28
MAAKCSLTGKKASPGRSYVYRGIAKWKGGIGRKVTGKTKRWFKPNLQKVKVIEANGEVHRIWVCTKALKSGLVNKAPKQSLAAAARAAKKK